MKQLWKKVIKPILFGTKNLHRYKAKIDQKIPEDHTVPWTIYGDDVNIHKWGRDFRKLQVWKHRIFLPAVRLMRYLQGPLRHTQARKHRGHDELITRFNKAFDEAAHDWCKKYRLRNQQNPTTEEINKQLHTSAQLLYEMKQAGLALILNDTAYKEFFHMLLLRITVNMNQLSGEATTYNHLLYGNPTKTIADIEYFYLSEGIRESYRRGEDITIKFTEKRIKK